MSVRNYNRVRHNPLSSSGFLAAALFLMVVLQTSVALSEPTTATSNPPAVSTLPATGNTQVVVAGSPGKDQLPSEVNTSKKKSKSEDTQANIELMKMQAQRAPHVWIICVGLFVMVLLCGLGILAIKSAVMKNQTWSVPDALSEDVSLTVPDPATPGKLLVDAAEKPILKVELRASSSRLIAFMGSIAVLTLYIGAAVIVFYYFASGLGVPSGFKEVRDFLFSGIVLFAPYLINKFASVFDTFKS